MRKGLIDQVTQLRAQYPNYELFVTGHSLGAAQAALCAIDLAVSFNTTVTLYNMGEPRVGNKAFSTYFNQQVPNTYRIVHDNDIGE